jgi:hypothetical protein
MQFNPRVPKVNSHVVKNDANRSVSSAVDSSAASEQPRYFPAVCLIRYYIPACPDDGKPFRHKILPEKRIKGRYNLSYCQVTLPPKITITWYLASSSIFQISSDRPHRLNRFHDTLMGRIIPFTGTVCINKYN